MVGATRPGRGQQRREQHPPARGVEGLRRTDRRGRDVGVTRGVDPGDQEVPGLALDDLGDRRGLLRRRAVLGQHPADPRAVAHRDHRGGGHRKPLARAEVAVDLTLDRGDALGIVVARQPGQQPEVLRGAALDHPGQVGQDPPLTGRAGRSRLARPRQPVQQALHHRVPHPHRHHPPRSSCSSAAAVPSR
ncbi:hypothetical protein G5V59_16195 [Nocardioides sp. W3-2-3]|nr:hypothetical protein [Nocardioides convexus]NHA00930.1 hypothetical protein [Nocardioides convexus]